MPPNHPIAPRGIHRLGIALLFALISLHAPASWAWPWPAEDTITLRVLPESRGSNDKGPLSQPGGGRELSLRNDILWYHRNDLLTLQWSGTSSHTEGKRSTRQGVLNELFIDHTLGDFDVTVGKKMMTYGVGYALRPLDIVQRERPLPLQPLVLEGIPIASLEKFTANSAYSAIYVHRQDSDQEPYRGQASEVSVRAAFTRRLWDFHTLAHYSDATGWSMGADFATVYGRSLSAYGGLLWQQQHRLLHAVPADTALETPQPGGVALQWNEEGSALKGVAGLSYTWESGFTLIGELSYNGTARSGNDWRNLLGLAPAGRESVTQTGGEPNSAGPFQNEIAAGLAQPDFVREAIFLRLSHDGDRIDPSLELYHSPDAGGGFVTAHVNVELKDRHRLSLGARHYFGGSDSPFGALPIKNQIYAGWEWSFAFGGR